MPDVKPYRGMGMEGAVAKWYSGLTKKSMNDFKELARSTAGSLPAGSAVLEVAPGPGYFAIELAKAGDYQIAGLDISETFVEIARKNAGEARVQVDFQWGNASNMPFFDCAFDFLLCRAAFKNFSEPVRALQEMYRVLKPGGRALIIDLRGDASNESIAKAVSEMKLGAVNGMMTRLVFRFMLLKRAYTRDEFEQMIAETKFDEVEIQENLMGFDIMLTRGRFA